MTTATARATDLTIAERRVDELQDVLAATMSASTRLESITRELKGIGEAFEQASEAIYNATLYDPEGERDDDA